MHVFNSEVGPSYHIGYVCEIPMRRVDLQVGFWCLWGSPILADIPPNVCYVATHPVDVQNRHSFCEASPRLCQLRHV